MCVGIQQPNFLLCQPVSKKKVFYKRQKKRGIIDFPYPCIVTWACDLLCAIDGGRSDRGPVPDQASKDLSSASSIMKKTSVSQSTSPRRNERHVELSCPPSPPQSRTVSQSPDHRKEPSHNQLCSVEKNQAPLDQLISSQSTNV